MKKFGKLLLIVAVVLAGAFGYWRYDHADREHAAAKDAIAALGSDDVVTVESGKWFIFRPTHAAPRKGLIFYPGGECDERGYAQPLRAIAAAGYLVVMPPMPLQLAVFDPNAAGEVIQAFPEIRVWAVAGHSLGGSMAAYFAHNNPSDVAGLLLWDAYAADDMSSSSLKIRMIHRSDETGATPEGYDTKLPLLPQQTEFVPISGAQHLNFGNFIAGRMYRDEPPPELDPTLQRAMVAAASIQFMDAL